MTAPGGDTATAGDSAPDPLDGAMVECGAPHCPTRYDGICDWPKCAVVVMPEVAP